MKFFKLLIIVALVVGFFIHQSRISKPKSVESQTQTATYSDASKILNAYRTKDSHFFVDSTGIVERILSDDLKQPRHQRFIVRLAHGQTLLITHNIDLAPRIDTLKVGDRVNFRGEYIYNDKGGIIHYTHRTVTFRQIEHGWIDHDGLRYW